MQRHSTTLALLGLLALVGSAVATPDPNALCAGKPQLCRDCVTAVSQPSVSPDGFGNTADSLAAQCPLCTSDLCKQCLAYRANAFGKQNRGKGYYPACTQPYLAIADGSLFNGVYSKSGVAGGSTKTLCPYITTSDTLKCFDLGYGSPSSPGGSFGEFEYLCYAAVSDLQRRCLWQYTSLSGADPARRYSYEGLPTNAYNKLIVSLPLCLHLQSEAQYQCLRDQVFALPASPAAKATQTMAAACGIASGVTAC